LTTARLRILSCNLWNGGADPQAFADLVEELDADVVAMCELAPEQAEAVAKVRPHGLFEPRRDFLGMGLALRHPAPARRLPLPHRDARAVRLDPGAWPGLAAPLEVIGVHIMGPHAWPWSTSWPARRGQLRELLRYLGAADPIGRVVIGDYNATPLWPLYRRLRRRLHDAAEIVAARTGRRPERTWRPTPRFPRLLRIDHALTSAVTVRDFRVRDVPGGDHSAILVEVSAADR
jgi:endonuclease/exonuclease/phosphatase (EEP) superfamily protein YafD